LQGVFGLGFGVGFLRTYIQELKIGEAGRVFSVHPVRGEILVSPSEVDRERLGPVVEQAVSRVSGGVESLPANDLRVFAISRNGTAYRVGVERRHPEGLPSWVQVIVIPEDELVGFMRGYLPGGLAAIAVLLIGAIGLAQLLAQRVSRPLREIAADLQKVGDFELSETPPPRSFVSEVEVVGAAAQRMKASLRSFGRYVPTDLVRGLLSEGQEAALGGVEKDLTLFFSDVKGFTSASEGMSPSVLVDALGDYLAEVTRTVREQQGTIDKFIGDGVLAFFNAPHDDPDHVTHGCRAALTLQAALDRLVPQWEAAGRPSFVTRIGLHTDRVVVGNIGTPERFAYTVIGDGVNFAARLESLNKAYGTSILASSEVRERAGSEFVWRRLDRTAVAGRTVGGDVFELLGTADTIGSDRIAARDAYEAALESYFAFKFSEAGRGFAEATQLRQGDKAARVLLERARRYAENPPPEDWNGVYVQTSK
jgi:adenylate cyclase